MLRSMTWRRRAVYGGIVMLALALLAPASGLAQAADAGGGEVTGVGTVPIVRQPELVRATILVTAKGASPAEALAKLSSVQEDIRGKLAELNAVADSAKFADPAIGIAAGPESEIQRMQRMFVAQQRRGQAAPTTGPTSVTVSSTLTAEWAISPADAAELLVKGTELQEKIKSAGLVPQEADKELSEEEQEMMEEMEQEVSFGEAPVAKPGEATFTYVCRISAEDVEKVTADAFNKAKASAARLARAAGAEIGNLRIVSSNSTSATASADDPYAMYRAMMGTTAAAASGVAQDDGSIEVTSDTLGPIKYDVAITASFSLKE